MILRAVLAAAIFSTAAHADFDRNLNVSGPADLFVSTGSGHIHIFPGSDTEFHIKARVYAGWNAGSDIQDRIRKISANPPIEQSGNAIHLGDVRPEDRHLYNNITIDYEISAPKTTALNLRSGSGDINVENLGRFLKADTGSGSVRAHGIAGPAELRTGSGDIDLEEQAAGEVKASTGSGSVRINGLSGPLTARTGSGDIEANGTLTGPSRLQSGSGSIRLHLQHDARYNVDAATGSGSIKVPGSTSDHHHLSAPINGGGPSLELRTGSGDIEIT